MYRLVILFLALFFTATNGQIAINAIDLDGVDDYVNCGTDSSLDISEFITIEAWVKMDSIQSIWAYHRIVDKYWYTIQQGYELVVDAYSITSHFEFWATNGSKHVIIGNVPLNDQAWHHLAASYDGEIMKLYLDGQIETEITIGKFYIRQCSNFLGIGNNHDGNVWHPFGGEIDEVRLWDVARTQAQIQQTMYDTLSSNYYVGADSGLIGYWKFDSMEDLGINGDGADDIRDLSYNSNHGDCNNDPVLVPSGAFVTKVEGGKLYLPEGYTLHQNYPNPFNPTTIIKYTLPKSEKVKIEVFNLLGQKTETLINKQMPSGSHKIEFTAKDLPSGVYLYRIEAGEYQHVQKMILLK